MIVTKEDLGKALGVAVIYAPGLNASTTAEHALMLMLAARIIDP